MASTEQSGGIQQNREQAIRTLYRQLLEAWNQRDARGFAGLCDENCNMIGFDGSQLDGRAQIQTELARIFAGHPTAAYVSKVREVRFLAPHIALLRAVVGMVPPGKSDLNAAVNAIQSLIARQDQDRWAIALFQNTPAAFHGRPELSEQLTNELREVLRSERA